MFWESETFQSILYFMVHLKYLKKVHYAVVFICLIMKAPTHSFLELFIYISGEYQSWFVPLFYKLTSVLLC